jgi:hypothetical protein
MPGKSRWGEGGEKGGIRGAAQHRLSTVKHVCINQSVATFHSPWHQPVVDLFEVHNQGHQTTTPNKSSGSSMVVVVKRVRTTRPSLINQRNVDSMTTMRTDGGKSESSSSLKSNTSRSPSSKSCRVCFALDYNVPDEVVPSPGVLSEKEIGSCFYSVRELPSSQTLSARCKQV